MSANALPYRPHNHDACVSRALADARAICQQNNARLTPTRERVLELIWQSHKPLGAYDVLAVLAEDGHNAAPPTVYRALDFLQQHGLVHRIASLNSFVGCTHAGKNHNGLFLICRQCSNVLELTAPAVASAVSEAASAEAFSPEDVTIEVAGLCPRCQADAGND
ncbi:MULTISPECIES: Fur family transcriptional regulator [Marinobacter]|jgi:Fur family zinc uptake transcriptional regulator|uniref:Fur family transcriptional regulator n=1 Tax=Marinobacter TaxID=2742 RepID=UPI00200486DE|nr:MULTISPECIES: Fur family transcriptional regulator [Marinobacter]MCK7550823.1 transcriptional repressor [Marinobacter goseongensis]MDV3504723.1 Fur family transcriptional regulator [Marinobacter sp. M-5]